MKSFLKLKQVYILKRLLVVHLENYVDTIDGLSNEYGSQFFFSKTVYVQHTI